MEAEAAAGPLDSADEAFRVTLATQGYKFISSEFQFKMQPCRGFFCFFFIREFLRSLRICDMFKLYDVSCGKRNSVNEIEDDLLDTVLED